MKKLEFDVMIYPHDIDAMNHVSNIAYIRWMEMGRCKLFDEVGMPVHQLIPQGYGPVLAETQIKYKRQLMYGDAVKVQTWFSELSRATAWIDFIFTNGQSHVVATGRQRGAFIEFSSGKPKRISADDRDKFEVFLVPEQAEA